jgi:hypothetical protein
LHEGLIEKLPLEGASVDVVISNGVIDLIPDKACASRLVTWPISMRRPDPRGRERVQRRECHLHNPRSLRAL